MTLTVQQITQRLEEIEADVEARQSKGETAAEDFHKAKRDFELEYAKAFVSADGSATEKKQRATVAVHRTAAYGDLLAAEGAYEGWKAAMRTLELRASIGQSLLRAQREYGG